MRYLHTIFALCCMPKYTGSKSFHDMMIKLTHNRNFVLSLSQEIEAACAKSNLSRHLSCTRKKSNNIIMLKRYSIYQYTNKQTFLRWNKVHETSYYKSFRSPLNPVSFYIEMDFLGDSLFNQSGFLGWIFKKQGSIP